MAAGTAALSSATDTAGELGRKYAPAALGGTDADAAYAGPSRSGAGVGANPQQGDIDGLDPVKGLPRDAPVSEAATGGNAGKIAGVAAAVASGQSEGAAAKGLQQVRAKGH